MINSIEHNSITKYIVRYCLHWCFNFTLFVGCEQITIWIHRCVIVWNRNWTVSL